MDRMNDSILVTIKKMLGLDDEYTPFDTDVMIHINAAFMTLTQMGVGPKEGFEVSDYDQTWSDFLVNKVMLGAVKTWVYLQVKMAFDPPTNSFVMDAMKTQSEQILWRLNVQAESVEVMPFMTEDGLKRGANPKNIPPKEDEEEGGSEDEGDEDMPAPSGGFIVDDDHVLVPVNNGGVLL